MARKLGPGHDIMAYLDHRLKFSGVEREEDADAVHHLHGPYGEGRPFLLIDSGSRQGKSSRLRRCGGGTHCVRPSQCSMPRHGRFFQPEATVPAESRTNVKTLNGIKFRTR